MPTADDCIPQVFVCRTRVATLDLDGTPNGNSYVSDALQRVTMTPNYEAGTEIKEENGCGNTFIDVLADPTFKRVDWEMEFLTPDPYLHDILLSGGLLLASGGRVGFAFPPLGTVSGQVSLEFWSQRIDQGNLSAVFPYAHWALPYCKSMQLGARELSNSAQHALITGQALENHNWFDGPGDDWPSVEAPADRCVQWIPDTSMPDAQCGPTTVVPS